MALGGTNVGTGMVPIKPDATGFGSEMERQIDREAGPASKRSGDKLGAGIALAAKATFAAGIATIGKGIFDAAGFDKGMREVFTVIPGISGEAMAEMKEQAKDFAAEFGVLPQQVASAAYDAIGAGIPQDELFHFLENAQKLAKAGSTELGVAVDGLSSVVNAYGSDVIGVDRASDVLFQSVALGKGTVDEFARSLYEVIPAAAANNIAFEDIGAALAILTAQGVPVSSATSQIRAAIVELTKSGTKASDLFKAQFGETFNEYIDGGGNLIGATERMDEALRITGQNWSDVFGSVEAAGAMQSLSKDMDQSLDFLGQMRDSAGSTQAAFEVMNVGMAATFDRVKARLSVALIDLGENLAPLVGTIGEGLADLIDMFNQLPAPMQNAIVLGGTLLAGVIAFAGPMAKVVTLGGELIKVFSLLAANPWTLVVLVLAGAAYLVWKNWDAIKVKLAKVWESIGKGVEKLRRVFEKVRDFFRGFWRNLFGSDPDITSSGAFGMGEKIGLAIRNGFTSGLAKITEPFEKAWGFVTDLTHAVFDELENFFTVWGDRIAFVFGHTFDFVRMIWTETFDAVTAATATAIDAVMVVLQPLIDVFQIVIPAALDFYRFYWSTVWSAVRSVAETAWGILRGIFDAIKGKVDLVVGAFVILQTIASIAWTVIKTVVGGAIDFLVARLGDLRAAAENALGPVGKVLGAVGSGIYDAGKWLVGHDDGGVVGAGTSAPRGAPMPILAHVGETVLPTHKAPVSAFLGGGGNTTIEAHLHVDGNVDREWFEAQLENFSVELVRAHQREIDRQRLAAGQPRGVAA